MYPHKRSACPLWRDIIEIAVGRGPSPVTQGIAPCLDPRLAAALDAVLMSDAPALALAQTIARAQEQRLASAFLLDALEAAYQDLVNSM